MHGHSDTHLKQYPLSDIRRTKATILLYSKHGSQYNLTENFHQNLDGELDEGWLKATELVIPLSVHVNTVWILSLFTKLCQWELLERNEGKNHTSLKKSNLTMGTRLQMNVVLLFKKKNIYADHSYFTESLWLALCFHLTFSRRVSSSFTSPSTASMAALITENHSKHTATVLSPLSNLSHTLTLTHI